jgi:hypothetical protein
MDQTSSKPINNHMQTVADKGGASVTCLFDGDPKACITVIATINATGKKFPLWVVAKGATSRCETRYRRKCSRALELGQFHLTHHSSGWTNHEVAKAYLNWLAELTVSREEDDRANRLGEVLLLEELQKRRRTWTPSSKSLPEARNSHKAVETLTQMPQFCL